MHIHIHVYMCIHIYMCMYIYIYIYIYIYTYIHTHIYIHIYVHMCMYNTYTHIHIFRYFFKKCHFWRFLSILEYCTLRLEFTGWLRWIGCLNSREMTYKDKASCGFSPTCNIPVPHTESRYLPLHMHS